jgi:hypothetical protein
MEESKNFIFTLLYNNFYMMCKVQIIPKNRDFLDDFFLFLFEKSEIFRRDISIDNILNDTTSLKNFEYLEKVSPILLKDVFGSTFQTSYRNNDDIYAISHDVVSIEFTDGKIFGNINPSTYGEIINFDGGCLRPVYYKKNDKSEYQIATFDIDFNIMPNHDSN